MKGCGDSVPGSSQLKSQNSQPHVAPECKSSRNLDCRDSRCPIQASMFDLYIHVVARYNAKRTCKLPATQIGNDLS